MKPAIVIPAFARPAALQRLLTSLAAADIPTGVPLVVTVDHPAQERHRAGHAEVLHLAQHFHWPHGPQRIIRQPEHLGLVGNVFYAGSLAAEFGAIILLEDDLFVSRRIFDYANQALEAYDAEPRLAGISLNTLWLNGFTHQPFVPLPDDGEVYFLQLSTPQGQVYTAAQWTHFAEWLAVNGRQVTTADNMHELFAAFPSDDWLAVKAKYLAATNRYYVYPRESLTTNFGEPGTHFDRPTALFQTPLQQLRREFRFIPFDAAVAVYDGFYEMLPDRLRRLAAGLPEAGLDVDLYATKAAHQLRGEYVLTTRRCRQPLATFGRAMWPLEANVMEGVPGEGISLARRSDVDLSQAAAHDARRENDRYFARYRSAEGGGRRLLRRMGRLIGRGR
jgi:hypothetical protein